MANQKLGGESGVVFGTTDETFGFIQNLQKKTVVEEVELKNGTSDIVVVEQVSKKTEIQGEYIYRATGGADNSSVGSGTKVSIDGTDYYIKESTEHLAIGEFKKISFVGTNFPSLSTTSSS